MMTSLYDIVKDGKLGESIVLDGTSFQFTGRDLIITTSGGYKFEISNVYKIRYIGREEPTNDQTR